MTKTAYSEEKLFELGKVHYEKLVLYCMRLEEKGFWAQAEKVIKKSSTEVLDLYVQSVLMNLAVHCGEILDSQREFMRSVTAKNPLGIPKQGKIKKSTYNDSRRMYELPPVLLQLCGLYDKQNGADMTEYFLDSFLNILLCMAYLNEGKSERVNEFISRYCEKISNFIIDRDANDCAEYIVKKLSSGEIRCDAEWLKGRRKRSGRQNARSAADMRESGAPKKKKAKSQKQAKNKPDATTGGKAEGRNALVGENAVMAAVEAEKSAREEQERQKEKERQKKREEFFKRVEEDGRLAREEEERQRAEQDRLAREQFLVVKKRLQDRERAAKEEQERKIGMLMEELNSLVGLSNVKKEIRSLTNLIKIRQLRDRMSMPVMDMSYHMVFTGSPGTGKTTVARLVGRIYKELGILSDGKMIETDRSGLVAGYVGQTAIKVHDMVEQAIGGVLFIDEAYSLVNPDVPNDFGGEAVDALVKLMEDHRDNLVIIVAGYTNEMKTFLKSNTGLISRFNKFIDFPDYSKEELLEIMGVMAKDAGLSIEDSAKAKVLGRLDEMSPDEWRDFGNARGIRNMFEKIVMNQANRLVEIENPTKEQLMAIKGEDVII